MTSFSPKPRSVFSAVCRSNGIVLGRTRATVGSRFPRNIRLASAYSNPAAFILPGGGPLRLAIDATRTLKHLASRIFSRGPLLISNSVGAFKALRSLSSNAFVQFCQEPTSRVFHRLTLAPAFLSVPVDHGNNHDSRRVGNAQIPSGEIRNVVR